MCRLGPGGHGHEDDLLSRYQKLIGMDHHFFLFWLATLHLALPLTIGVRAMSLLSKLYPSCMEALKTRLCLQDCNISVSPVNITVASRLTVVHVTDQLKLLSIKTVQFNLWHQAMNRASNAYFLYENGLWTCSSDKP